MEASHDIAPAGGDAAAVESREAADDAVAASAATPVLAAAAAMDAAAADGADTAAAAAQPGLAAGAAAIPVASPVPVNGAAPSSATPAPLSITRAVAAGGSAPGAGAADTSVLCIDVGDDFDEEAHGAGGSADGLDGEGEEDDDEDDDSSSVSSAPPPPPAAFPLYPDAAAYAHVADPITALAASYPVACRAVSAALTVSGCPLDLAQWADPWVNDEMWANVATVYYAAVTPATVAAVARLQDRSADTASAGGDALRAWAARAGGTHAADGSRSGGGGVAQLPRAFDAVPSSSSFDADAECMPPPTKRPRLEVGGAASSRDSGAAGSSSGAATPAPGASTSDDDTLFEAFLSNESPGRGAHGSGASHDSGGVGGMESLGTPAQPQVPAPPVPIIDTRPLPAHERVLLEDVKQVTHVAARNAAMLAALTTRLRCELGIQSLYGRLGKFLEPLAPEDEAQARAGAEHVKLQYCRSHGGLPQVQPTAAPTSGAADAGTVEPVAPASQAGTALELPVVQASPGPAADVVAIDAAAAGTAEPPIGGVPDAPPLSASVSDGALVEPTSSDAGPAAIGKSSPRASDRDRKRKKKRVDDDDDSGMAGGSSSGGKKARDSRGSEHKRAPPPAAVVPAAAPVVTAPIHRPRAPGARPVCDELADEIANALRSAAASASPSPPPAGAAAAVAASSSNPSYSGVAPSFPAGYVFGCVPHAALDVRATDADLAPLRTTAVVMAPPNAPGLIPLSTASAERHRERTDRLLGLGPAASAAASAMTPAVSQRAAASTTGGLKRSASSASAFVPSGVPSPPRAAVPRAAAAAAAGLGAPRACAVGSSSAGELSGAATPALAGREGSVAGSGSKGRRKAKKGNPPVGPQYTPDGVLLTPNGKRLGRPPSEATIAKRIKALEAAAAAAAARGGAGASASIAGAIVKQTGGAAVAAAPAATPAAAASASSGASAALAVESGTASTLACPSPREAYIASNVTSPGVDEGRAADADAAVGADTAGDVSADDDSSAAATLPPWFTPERHPSGAAEHDSSSAAPVDAAPVLPPVAAAQDDDIVLLGQTTVDNDATRAAVDVQPQATPAPDAAEAAARASSRDEAAPSSRVETPSPIASATEALSIAAEAVASDDVLSIARDRSDSLPAVALERSDVLGDAAASVSAVGVARSRRKASSVRRVTAASSVAGDDIAEDGSSATAADAFALAWPPSVASTAAAAAFPFAYAYTPRTGEEAHAVFHSLRCDANQDLADCLTLGLGGLHEAMQAQYAWDCASAGNLWVDARLTAAYWAIAGPHCLLEYTGMLNAHRTKHSTWRWALHGEVADAAAAAATAASGTLLTLPSPLSNRDASGKLGSSGTSKAKPASGATATAGGGSRSGTGAAATAAPQAVDTAVVAAVATIQQQQHLHAVARLSAQGPAVMEVHGLPVAARVASHPKKGSKPLVQQPVRSGSMGIGTAASTAATTAAAVAAATTLPARVERLLARFPRSDVDGRPLVGHIYRYSYREDAMPVAEIVVPTASRAGVTIAGAQASAVGAFASAAMPLAAAPEIASAGSSLESTRQPAAASSLAPASKRYLVLPYAESALDSAVGEFVAAGLVARPAAAGSRRVTADTSGADSRKRSSGGAKKKAPRPASGKKPAADPPIDNTAAIDVAAVVGDAGSKPSAAEAAPADASAAGATTAMASDARPTPTPPDATDAVVRKPPSGGKGRPTRQRSKGSHYEEDDAVDDALFSVLDGSSEDDREPEDAEFVKQHAAPPGSSKRRGRPKAPSASGGRRKSSGGGKAKGAAKAPEHGGASEKDVQHFFALFRRTGADDDAAMGAAKQAAEDAARQAAAEAAGVDDGYDTEEEESRRLGNAKLRPKPVPFSVSTPLLPQSAVGGRMWVPGTGARHWFRSMALEAATAAILSVQRSAAPELSLQRVRGCWVLSGFPQLPAAQADSLALSALVTFPSSPKRPRLGDSIASTPIGGAGSFPIEADGAQLASCAAVPDADAATPVDPPASVQDAAPGAFPADAVLAPATDAGKSARSRPARSTTTGAGSKTSSASGAAVSGQKRKASARDGPSSTGAKSSGSAAALARPMRTDERRHALMVAALTVSHAAFHPLMIAPLPPGQHFLRVTMLQLQAIVSVARQRLVPFRKRSAADGAASGGAGADAAAAQGLAVTAAVASTELAAAAPAGDALGAARHKRRRDPSKHVFPALITTSPEAMAALGTLRSLHGAPHLSEVDRIEDLAWFAAHVPLGTVVDARDFHDGSWCLSVVIGETRDAGVLRRFVRVHFAGWNAAAADWISVADGKIAPAGYSTVMKLLPDTLPAIA